LRRGLAVGIERPDVTPLPGTTPITTTDVQITLEYSIPNKAIANLTLVGPGDIVGLDPRAVVRTFPRADDNDAQVGFFVMIEFDQPDLPWRYTPAASVGDPATAADKLRPWFNLIVLEEGTELTDDQIDPAGADRKLPVLHTFAKFLPDLNDSWAFAHTQVKGTPPAGGFDSAALTAPGAALARLLAPRSLKKQTAYRAMLVTTFERGRLVGTQQLPGDTDGLQLAWLKTDPEAKVDLPIYYQWRFQTGTAGRFEDLALALQPNKDLGPDIGARKLDVSTPGLDLPTPSVDPNDSTKSLPLDMGGALQSLAAKNLTPPTFTTAWLLGLKAFIDDPKRPFEEAGVLRVVAPPMYGRWYAQQTSIDPPLPPPATNPPWFYALNTDPRHRVSAALGTEVVQREQEALMESAWEQARSLVLINVERKIMQLGREVWKRFIARHIAAGFAETVLTTTALLHGRVLRAGTTIFTQITNSPLISGFFEPAWRRLLSPQGAIGRRLQLDLLPLGTPTNLFDRVNKGDFQPAPPPGIPKRLPTPVDIFDPLVAGGLEDRQVSTFANRLGKDALNFWGQVLFWAGRQALVAENGQLFWLAHKLIRLGISFIRLAADPLRTIETLREKLRKDSLTSIDIAPTPATTMPGFVPIDDLPDLFGGGALPAPPQVPGSGPDSTDAGFYRQAVQKLLDRLRKPVKQFPLLQPIDISGTMNDLITALDPEKTYVAASKLRHIVLDGNFQWNATDELEPYQAAPTFSQPMYVPLRAVSPEWILPGAGQLERNTVSAVVTNQRFVEAYMVGLNHEMTRELLWREYPIDQRGTYFQQFWDARGWVAGSSGATTPDLRDIKEVRLWGMSQLGENTARSNVPADFLVLLVRGDLIKRYPNVIVYAAKAHVPSETRLPDDSQQEHPILHGTLGDDIAFYGFPFTPQDARGDTDNKGWYVVLQEQPAEPRFDLPGATAEGQLVKVSDLVESGPPAFNPSAAGKIAAHKFHEPVRVAIHGSEFVPASA
jgi:hypothetical protein